MTLSLKKKIVIWYTIWMSILAVLFIAVAFASSGYVSGNRVCPATGRAPSWLSQSWMRLRNFMMKAGSSLMRTVFSFPFLMVRTTCSSGSFPGRFPPSAALMER